MGPDALGSNTDASTVRWVPPVTSGGSPAVAEVKGAATARERVAVTANVRATVRMDAPGVRARLVPRLRGACGANGRGVLYPAKSWYVANIGLLPGFGGVPCARGVAMATSAVSITTGACDSAQVDVDDWAVSAITFPAGLVLARHEHPHATVALVVRGGFAGDYHSG